MELTQEEKQQIINQRLKQFAAEKFNHELNKQILEAQLDKTEDKEPIQVQIDNTDEAISIIETAIETASAMVEPVEVVAEPIVDIPTV